MPSPYRGFSPVSANRTWYGKAVDQDDSLAQNNLGVMYEQGLGVAKDDAEAVRWFRKAAEQGDTVGQKNLEDVYRRGGAG